MPKKIPCSADAENAVLGGLIIDNEKWHLVDGLICDSDFYYKDNRFIYGLISRLAAEKKPFDIVTLSELIQQEEGWRETYTVSFISDLARNTPSSSNIVHYAQIVKEKSQKRQLILTLENVLSDCYSRQKTSFHELSCDAQNAINIISSDSDSPSPVKISDLLPGAIDYVESVSNKESGIMGVSTGFKELDFLTGGLREGELIVLAARPSMGKTSLALNIAHSSLKEKNKACVFFSLEMPSNQLVLRLFSAFGGVNQNKIRQGLLTDNDWHSIGGVTQILSDANLFIDDSAGLTLSEIRSRAYRIASEGNLGLIVIDYLQLIQSKTRFESRTSEVSAISLGLKNLAKELKVPVIALSQLNRNLENRPNKRPTLSDLRDSGAVEQDSDLVLFIYRDEVYNESSIDAGFAEIIIAKHRNGPTGIIKLKFSGEFTLFEDIL